eukprot:ANDGO_06442.mRNA.1 hypothetical protein SPRG_09383
MDLHEVYPRLFISSLREAEDVSLLKAHKIALVINVAHRIDSAYHPQHFQYLTLSLSDDVHQDLLSAFPVIFPAIQNILRFDVIERGTVLIHCLAGRSRSASVALGFILYDLMCRIKEDRLEEGYSAFPCSMQNWVKHMFPVCTSPSLPAAAATSIPSFAGYSRSPAAFASPMPVAVQHQHSTSGSTPSNSIGTDNLLDQELATKIPNSLEFLKKALARFSALHPPTRINENFFCQLRLFVSKQCSLEFCASRRNQKLAAQSIRNREQIKELSDLGIMTPARTPRSDTRTSMLSASTSSSTGMLSSDGAFTVSAADGHPSSAGTANH